ncbi:hypothetical protein RND71_039705 [Anisodus tanguticus]|uniref:Uncharacterized protein n=1 Tax=Anisodus tanguticus TaxID=243964 RepID=A0AAE1QWB8_9SOLA|nr:hypothetical protein RND71_039705 [Anisodus tanguticus]
MDKVENVDEGYKDEGSLTSVEKEEVSAVLVEELKESTADTSPLKLEHLHSDKSLVEEGYVEVEITGEDISENVTKESEGINVPTDHCGNKELNDESVILNQGSFIERDKIEVLPSVELNMQSTKDNIRIDNIFSPTEGSVHFMSNNKGVMSNELSIQKENINYVTVQRKPSPNKELHALVSHDLNSMDKNLESVQTKEHIQVRFFRWRTKGKEMNDISLQKETSRQHHDLKLRQRAINPEIYQRPCRSNLGKISTFGLCLNKQGILELVASLTSVMKKLIVLWTSITIDTPGLFSHGVIAERGLLSQLLDMVHSTRVMNDNDTSSIELVAGTVQKVRTVHFVRPIIRTILSRHTIWPWRLLSPYVFDEPRSRAHFSFLTTLSSSLSSSKVSLSALGDLSKVRK